MHVCCRQFLPAPPLHFYFSVILLQTEAFNIDKSNLPSVSLTGIAFFVLFKKVFPAQWFLKLPPTLKFILSEWKPPTIQTPPAMHGAQDTGPKNPATPHASASCTWSCRLTKSQTKSSTSLSPKAARLRPTLEVILDSSLSPFLHLPPSFLDRSLLLKVESKNSWTYFEPLLSTILCSFSSFCHPNLCFQILGFLFYFLVAYYIVYILFLWTSLPFIHSRVLWLLSLIFLMLFVWNIYWFYVIEFCVLICFSILTVIILQ